MLLFNMYYLAAILLFMLGVAHSYLGERLILIRLFERDNLPKLFGGTEFTKNTLRFAWHLTTIAWFGFALILVHLAGHSLAENVVATIIAVTFLLHGVIVLVFSKAKHFSWPVFLVIGIASLYAANS